MYQGSYHVSKGKHEKGFKTSCMLEASYNLVLLWCKADVRDCLCFSEIVYVFVSIVRFVFFLFACPHMSNAHLKCLWDNGYLVQNPEAGPVEKKHSTWTHQGLL